jgi:hypothetical protein
MKKNEKTNKLGVEEESKTNINLIYLVNEETYKKVTLKCDLYYLLMFLSI